MPRSRFERALGLALGLWSTSSAAAADLPIGEWRLGARPDALGDELDAAVAEIADEMSSLVRPFARELLFRVSQPCDRLSIWSEGEAVAIRCDDQAPAVAVPDGRPCSYTGYDGRTHTLILERDGDRLVQRFETARGSRVNTYSVENGTLRVDVRLESPRIPRPLEYTVAYR